MDQPLDLGAFSVSLSVADLDRSRDFYERLGFRVTGGSTEERYLILVSGSAVIGLFHGLFDRNILTFNPGVVLPVEGEGAQPHERFTDVRDIQARLLDAGLHLTETTDPDGTGPGHIVLVDPDGNPILIDQFSDRPG